ncbi:M20/M25/M40 family metallo-hydrolase [Parabacteroides chinchillae]|uniref:Acetylornithine deacetylase/Succinyl-diaminopimelate desuccinylase n=1 Tax=Parabacteroides chinchillae TaxID=871327 RepID=A0A8G2F181_9BACT|nr:M20/M25/M40 family metallo-hydrolase [Parabacteroides chinchillae]SEF80362.1 Acetylornithine deacetylase/Succinyl-diaminopimelate desuccinylase [Parabacteroides chinchillae]
MKIDRVYNEIKSIIMQWAEEDKVRMAQLCSDLVRCKTPDPPGDTRSAMEVVERFMRDESLQYKILGVNDIMPNMVSSVQFSDKGRHLMFNGHLDTMPAGEEPGWSDDPWSGKIADGKVWGRGAGDMKGGVTALMFAYKYVTKLKDYLSGKVSLSLVSDEETGYGRGTGFLFESIPDEMVADAVLTAEPSGVDAVSFASKGYVQFSVRISTPGAIAGYSNDSKSAIRIAADIIRDLDAVGNIEVRLPEVLRAMLDDPEWVSYHTVIRGNGHAEQLAKITTDICTVNGGSLLCVIAPDCEFSASTVIPVGADPYSVYKKVEEIVSRYPEASLYWDGIDSADICSPFTEIAGLIQDTAEELCGKRPVMTPDIAISDCRYWRYRGIPAYWYGPDSFLCSAADEHVSIDEIFHIATTHALTAVKFLLPKSGKRTKREIMCYPPIDNDFEAELKPLPSQHIAYTRHSAKCFSEKELTPVIERGLDELYATLNNEGVTIGAIGMAIYEQKGSELEVITAYPVAPEVKAGNGYDVMELPEVEAAAVTVHRGALKSCGKTWRELGRWMKTQKVKPRGQYREIYVLGGHNPEPLWITELQQPLKQ